MDSEKGVHRKTDWRWLAIGVLALLFVSWSLAWGVADIAAFRARVWVEAWSHQVQQAAVKGQAYDPDPDDWEAARAAGERAVRLAPLSADYREGLARVYASRYLSTADGAAIALPFQEQALQQYRESIRLRPTWPYSYIALAQTLSRMNRFDAEFDRSLHMAIHYGPWEPAIMLAMTDMALDDLPRLSPEARQLVLDTLRRGQAWTSDASGNTVPYGDQIWARVAARHQQMVICSWLSMSDHQIRARCSPAGWK